MDSKKPETSTKYPAFFSHPDDPKIYDQPSQEEKNELLDLESKAKLNRLLIPPDSFQEKEIGQGLVSVTLASGIRKHGQRGGARVLAKQA